MADVHQVERPRPGPSRDTRAAILAVAAELFSEPGYDATSLRVIAQRLGITKAALYYHFANKEDILRALLAPMTDMFSEVLDRLEAARDVNEWADALTWMVGIILDNTAFFRLLARNRHTVQQLKYTVEGMDDHVGMHERVQAAVRSAASNQSEEIRMFAALGAVTGFDDWAPELLAEAPPDVIRLELRAAVRAILGIEPA